MQSIYSNERTDIVLLNSFQIFNKRHRVFLHSGILLWERELPSNSDTHTESATNSTQTSIPLTDVISCDLIPNKSIPSKPNRFKVFYAKRLSQPEQWNRWRQLSITIKGSDYRVVQQWVETIQKIIHEQTYRPRRLLLFVNPFGGKRQALQIYEKYSKRIFQLAKIDVDVIISQRSNQIQDIVQNQSLDHYDGIVCVGGDGTFSELFNGLIYKEMKRLGLDPVTPEYIPKPKIPIGIIPAGSTDTIAYCIHGTNDIQTAVIHIVLGLTNGLDLSSVSNRNGLIRMYASVLSYGYLGDVAADSENYRWMGPKRYDYSGFKKFMLNRYYEGEISLILDESDSSPTDGPGCYDICSRCNSSFSLTLNSSSNSCSIHSLSGIDTTNNPPSVIVNGDNEHDNGTKMAESIDEINYSVQRKVIQGKFFMINCANISCACARSPNGFSKYCHLGDGCFDLVIVRHTTFLNNIKFLLALSSKTGNISHLPNVEIYRAKNFTFRAPYGASIINDNTLTSSTQPIRSASTDDCTDCPAISAWNCDGEVLHEPDLVVQSHCQLLTVYRRGLTLKDEDVDKSMICGLCK